MIIAASFDTKNPELWVNRGLSYGDGLFETMRFNGNCIPLLEFHLNRLSKGLKKLQLKGFNRSFLDNLSVSDPDTYQSGENQQVQQSQEGQNSAIIKLMVFRASQPRTYTPLTNDIDWLIIRESLTSIESDKTLKLALAKQKISSQPELAGIKHLSRLEQVMLASELNQQQSVDDLLLLDAKQRVIETSYQNLVLIKDNQLFTPKLNHCGVKGVALKWLKANHQVKAKHIGLKHLKSCDGLMVCNSIRGFRLVDSIERSGKESISFGTTHLIHDKISDQWDALFEK